MMSKKTIRIISGAIALILVGAMVFSIIASSLSYAAAAEGDDLKDKLATLEEQKAAVRDEISKLGSQADEAERTRAALESEISITREQIQTVENYIARLQQQLDVKEAELVVAEKQLTEKEELLRRCVRETYEQGDSTYLDVLLNSTSLTNMLSRIEIVGQLMDYNKQVFTEFKAAKEDIENKRDELQKTQDEQKQFQTNLSYKVDELAASEAEQAALVQSLESYKAAKQAEEDRLDSEMSAVNDEIAAISRQEAAAGGASLYSGTFTWPAPGNTASSSAYGWRIHPIYGTRKYHAGEDIPAPTGAPIVAAASGTVSTAGWVSGYGNYTVINHGGGVMTAYGHQSAIYVSVGQQVTAGDQIGAVGSTGNSTGPHLHFEVYINGSTVNPMSYFS